jgi:hypothetical protein
MNLFTLITTLRHSIKLRRAASEPIGVLITALISLCFTAKAATFITKNHGKYSDESNWKSQYPGNYIKNGDTVYINSHITLNGDIVVKGILVVNERFSMTGENNLVILDDGMLINKGITLVKAINNKGNLINWNILETSADFINTGKLENHQSIVIGNMLDNTGNISGNMGNLIVNKRLVNTFPGKITGNIDICSNDFSNVGGGAIDSMSVSFCGNRIFSSMFLTARITSENIQLNLKNAAISKYKECQIEKSTDGQNYTTIAWLMTNDIKENNGILTYHDKSSISSNTLYYRMKLIGHDGTESFIPPVEVGSNIQNIRNSISKL